MKDLFKLLPDIIELFVPGFVFLYIYRYFVESKNKDFEVTAVVSVVLSHFFQVFSKAIYEEALSNKIEFNNFWKQIFPYLLSAVLAIIIVIIRKCSLYKNILIMIGKITGHEKLWEDFFDINRGTRVRFYTTYNHEKVIVEGDIDYYEPYDDGECGFVLKKYEIIYVDNKKKYSAKGSSIAFNTKNIHGIEAMYGKE